MLLLLLSFNRLSSCSFYRCASTDAIWTRRTTGSWRLSRTWSGTPSTVLGRRKPARQPSKRQTRSTRSPASIGRLRFFRCPRNLEGNESGKKKTIIINRLCYRSWTCYRQYPAIIAIGATPIQHLSILQSQDIASVPILRSHYPRSTTLDFLTVECVGNL